MRGTVILSLMAILAGCASAAHSELEEANAAAARLGAACNQKFPDPHKKPTVARQQCLNEAYRPAEIARSRILGPGSYDLANLSMARLVVIAEKYDRGEITAAQYDQARAEAQAAYSAELQSRQIATMMADAAQRQAAAAQQNAMWQAYGAAVKATVPPPTVTCDKFGSTITCR